MKKVIAFGVVLLLLQSASAFAFGDHDPYYLQLKGFSPELIDSVQAQVDRMEGRFPPAEPGKLKQIQYNMLNGDWIAPTHPFTYEYVEPPVYPKRHL